MNKKNLETILTSDNPVQVINKNMDILLEIVPEIKYMIGFEHKHPYHHLDVWEHTLLALSKSENDYKVRLTLLLHDIGKPFSCQEDGEIRHFKGHNVVSSELTREILSRLNYEKDFINEICKLVYYHDTPITEEDIMNDFEFCSTLYKVQFCDSMAHNPQKLEKKISYLNEVNKKMYKKQ